MRKLARTGALLGAAALVTVGSSGRGLRAEEQRLNVLFLAIDDLRPELGCYGQRHMVTPNLDRLASQGRLFQRHYVQVPTCGASRFALLTGRYPRKPAAYANGAFSLSPQVEPREAYSLPDLFRRHGYATVSLGKITHSPDGLRGGAEGRPLPADRKPELPFSWERTWGPAGEWGHAWSAFFGYAGGKTRVKKQVPAFEAADVPDTGYPDALTAEETIRELRRLRDRPFFLAAGFFKPHLPFNAPKKYWDLYSADRIHLSSCPEPPTGIDPKVSLHPGGELFGQYTEAAENGVVTEKHARRLRHAYYAATSYADAQVGKVLDELDRLGLAKNTVVVAWGDHGWHLGDLGVWGKHTLHEQSLRSALIIRTPGMKNPGKPAQAIVQSVDLFPTLAQVCRLPAPPGLDGASRISLLNDPNGRSNVNSLGFWRKGAMVGRTLRNNRYRLTRWTQEKSNEVAQVELYDHQADPHESRNVAAQHPEVVASLTEVLKQAP